MINSEKLLYESFLETEEKICTHACYYRHFIANFRGVYFRNCKMQEFKEKLKKFLERTEDDGK